MLAGTSLTCDRPHSSIWSTHRPSGAGSICQRNSRPTRASISGLRSGPPPEPSSAIAALIASLCGQLRDSRSSGRPCRDTGQIDACHVGANTIRVALGGYQIDRRLSLFPRLETAQGLDQHRTVAREVVELLRIVLARKRLQPRADAAAHNETDDAFCHALAAGFRQNVWFKAPTSRLRRSLASTVSTISRRLAAETGLLPRSPACSTKPSKSDGLGLASPRASVPRVRRLHILVIQSYHAVIAGQYS
jgi:hypothetical protein